MKGPIIMKDNFLFDLLKNRPNLAERYRSEQYKLSKEILFWKYKNQFSTEKTASFLNMSLKRYLEFEGGYTEHSIEEYEQCLMNLKLYDFTKKRKRNKDNRFYDLKLHFSKLASQQYKDIMPFIEESSYRNKNLNEQEVYGYQYNKDEKCIQSNLNYSTLSPIMSRDGMLSREEYEFVSQ